MVSFIFLSNTHFNIQHHPEDMAFRVLLWLQRDKQVK